MTKPVIHLVDDEPAVLKALSRLLRSEGYEVSSYESPRQFLDEHDGDSAGCIVLDLSMPQLTGLDLQQELVGRDSALPIIFLTGRGSIPSSVKAMRAGAVDFLTKPVNAEELLPAVRKALMRNEAMLRARAERREMKNRFASLTEREYEVMTHLICGKLNKQIATRLGTVEKTIKVHRARVMQKLGVGSMAELARLAHLAGIEPADSPS